MKRSFITVIISFFLLSLPSGALATIKVGLVLDKGGRDDKSFNASAFKGATEAEKKLGVSLKVVESSSDSAIEPSLRTFAQRGFDLVIGIGFIQQGPVEKVAKEFPKTKFLLVDSHPSTELPNVRSVIFNEHEGAFLVGAIAALTSTSGTVGFIGGMDIPLIRRFELGYRKGAETAKPGTKVISNYVGSSSDAWKNPMKAKELSLAQFNQKADVIFTAAGASGQGTFDAAEEMKKFAIGCDSNQNWIKPGRILTSMLKRVDIAVYSTIELAKNGQFKAGKFNMGLTEDAVGFALDEHNRAILTPQVEKKTNELKEKILKKQLSVPDYYVTSKAATKS